MGLPDPALAPDREFAAELLKKMPELQSLGQVDVKALCHKDSSEITPEDWIMMKEAILDGVGKGYDGFVVTHGTDTMAYSSTALSFLLPYPSPPIVFTGSQRPLFEVRSDARRNLLCSAAYAAEKNLRDVSIFFDTLLLQGNRSTKVHIEEFHAFDSPNARPLAEERLGAVFKPKLGSSSKRAGRSKNALERFGLKARFNGHIEVVRIFPGAQMRLSGKPSALLLESFGCGNLPLKGQRSTKNSCEELLLECQRRKIPVILTSQVHSGALHPEIYEMGRMALKLGAISSRDMTFEATVIKCMILAGNQAPLPIWKKLIPQSWAGEISPN